jgi:hypothetical protein
MVDTSLQVPRMLWDMFFFDFGVLLEEYRKNLRRLEDRSLPCCALGKLSVQMFNFVDVDDGENDDDTMMVMVMMKMVVVVGSIERTCGIFIV